MLLIVRASGTDLVRVNYQFYRNILSKDSQHLLHMCRKALAVTFSYKICQAHSVMWPYRNGLYFLITGKTHTYESFWIRRMQVQSSQDPG